MRLFNIVVLAFVAVCVVATRDVPAMWRPHNAKVNRADVIGITVALKRRNVDKLDRIFWDVSDPNSPRYGEHLNNEQMRELVSPGRAVVERVVSWLKENGALEVKVSKHDDSMTARFRLSSLESMLDVKFENFVHAQSGRVIARAMKAPNIPASISEHIELLAGLDGFPRIASSPLSQKRVPVNVTPAVIFAQYNVTKVPVRAGNVAAFFQDEGEFFRNTDMQLFCASFTPSIRNETCRVSKVVGQNWEMQPGVESALDSQYLLATSQGTTVWAYSYPDMDFCANLIALGNDVFTGHEYPWVLALSYGAQTVPNYCLGPAVTRVSQDFQKMGAMGITVVVASGDDGSGEVPRQGSNFGLLGTSFPASVPYCTAVGSTSFIEGNSGPEKAATDVNSGGGFSFDYAAPLFQKAGVDAYFRTQSKVPPFFSFNRAGRATPDVSVLAENFNVVMGGNTQHFSGSGCAAQTFAGLVTALNNVRLLNNKTLGFISPLLYEHPDAFTDITVGDNDVNAEGYGWYCTKGWDPVTGLGTPRFDKLLQLIQSINERERSRR